MEKKRKDDLNKGEENLSMKEIGGGLLHSFILCLIALNLHFLIIFIIKKEIGACILAILGTLILFNFLYEIKKIIKIGISKKQEKWFVICLTFVLLFVTYLVTYLKRNIL